MTPQVPQHIQIEMARRELKLLTRQRDMAASGIKDLTDGIAELNEPRTGNMIESLCVAVSSLISVRLLELQDHHHNLSERIPELENALKIADGGIVIPGMRVKS